VGLARYNVCWLPSTNSIVSLPRPDLRQFFCCALAGNCKKAGARAGQFTRLVHFWKLSRGSRTVNDVPSCFVEVMVNVAPVSRHDLSSNGSFR
jgi:hypothetical protein